MTQASTLDIGLRKIINAGTHYIPSILRLLDHAIALQRFEQPVDTPFTHVERSCQVRKSQTLLGIAQKIQQTKSPLYHWCRRYRRFSFFASIRLFAILNYSFFHGNSITNFGLEVKEYSNYYWQAVDVPKADTY